MVTSNLNDVVKSKEQRALPVEGRTRILKDVTSGSLVSESAIATLGEVGANYRRLLSVKMAAITGRNGKSFTREIAVALLREKFNIAHNDCHLSNCLGVPLSLLKLTEQDQIGVYELHSENPAELKSLIEMIKPEYGVITNIGVNRQNLTEKDHILAKNRAMLCEKVPAGGYLVLNEDEVWTQDLKRSAKAHVMTVGVERSAEIQAEKVVWHEESVDFDLNIRLSKEKARLSLPLVGHHQLYNTLSAVALAHILGLKMQDIHHAFSRLVLPRMRMQQHMVNGVRIINDCFSADFDSMHAALMAMHSMPCQGRKFLVIGDLNEQGKNLDEAHRQVGQQIGRAHFDRLILVGRSASLVGQSALDSGMKANSVLKFDSNIVAAEFLAEKLQCGDSVLVKGTRRNRLDEVVDFLVDHRQNTI